MADEVALDAEAIGEPFRGGLSAVTPAGARLAADAELLLLCWRWTARLLLHGSAPTVDRLTVASAIAAGIGVGAAAHGRDRIGRRVEW